MEQMKDLAISTCYWQVDARTPDPGIMVRAGLILRQGGLVAFPTETVYGLGADASDPRAVGRIFVAKGRPQDNPLIVHVADRGTVYRLAARVPVKAQKLMDAYWPGPLTLVLPAARGIPPQVTAGLDTVGLRMPAHPVALALIEAAGVPVAAPSANVSGRPSPTTAEHVLRDLDGRIEVVLDGGSTGIGVESTVVDMTGPVPVVLRPGGVTPADLEEVIGEVRLEPGIDGKLWSGDFSGERRDGSGQEFRPRSPGMKYRHYAPRAPLVLVEGDPERVTARVQELAASYLSRGYRVGILAYGETAGAYKDGEVVVAGCRRDPATVASLVFAALRQFDDLGVDVILAEGIEPRGVGLAVMNRLRRAAGQHIERV